ncbi:carboxylate--amine ligase [Natronolimnohabitans innermongolicus]|uniref:carboxylate--amine ligase n=1 Tax=Natronolimnohabitans innermongolicus TaxID=253107 RepID=UPI000677E601|nr:ATP-grasp domain-containing protein [Natronolimnohabitans innermongolicus]
MVLPVDEPTLETVVKHKDRLEAHATVPFLPYERLLVGLDKRRTIEAARRSGIPHPRTLFTEDVEPRTAADALGLPIVVKPRRESANGETVVCNSIDELERTVHRTVREQGPAIFQEFIPHGGERGVYTLYNDDGALAGLTVQKRLRSNPPEGGSSTYRETVDDPALVSLADEFLTGLDWRGLAMVEFRIDARTGEPKLMEINPRLWGSLALSVYAGVDFPYLLYRSASGETVEPDPRYVANVRARYLVGDALQALKRDDRTRAIRELLTPSPQPCCYDIESTRDPLPIAGHLAFALSAFGKESVGQNVRNVVDSTPIAMRSSHE